MSPQVITNWRKRGIPVRPKNQVLAIESAVEGQVTRHELAGDVYPLDQPPPTQGKLELQPST